MAKVLVIGTLADKPVIKADGDGKRIAGLSVFTRRAGSASIQGKPVGQQQWHLVVVTLPRLVEIAEKCLVLGDRILVEGELVTERWLDDLFQPCSITSIALCQEAHQLACIVEDADRAEGRGWRGFEAPSDDLVLDQSALLEVAVQLECRARAS